MCAPSGARLQAGVPYFFLELVISIHELRIEPSRNDALKATPNKSLQKNQASVLNQSRRHGDAAPYMFLASLCQWLRKGSSAWRKIVSIIICFFVSNTVHEECAGCEGVWPFEFLDYDEAIGRKTREMKLGTATHRHGDSGLSPVSSFWSPFSYGLTSSATNSLGVKEGPSRIR